MWLQKSINTWIIIFQIILLLSNAFFTQQKQYNQIFTWFDSGHRKLDNMDANLINSYRSYNSNTRKIDKKTIHTHRKTTQFCISNKSCAKNQHIGSGEMGLMSIRRADADIMTLLANMHDDKSSSTSAIFRRRGDDETSDFSWLSSVSTGSFLHKKSGDE